MENNGKANAMETLKAKVLELKENWDAPFWPLVGLALFFAVPVSGGTLALSVFLSGASPLVVLLVLLGMASYAFILYQMVYGFLKTLDRTYIAKPVHEEEDYS